MTKLMVTPALMHRCSCLWVAVVCAVVGPLVVASPTALAAVAGGAFGPLEGFAPSSAPDDADVPFTLEWSALQSGQTYWVAWGDYDADGDLDLAASDGIYNNHNGTLSAAPVRALGTNGSAAWGDFDSDGDLDLVVSGSYRNPARLYRNEGGQLGSSPVWTCADGCGGELAAWGDYDGNGTLDLALGLRLYRNTNKMLETSAAWAPAEYQGLPAVAWGDYDGDGDLDLAAATSPISLYKNTGATLESRPSWVSSESGDAKLVAWGDYDGDGDLDLAVGNNGQPNRLYRNEAGTLTAISVWSSQESDSTTSIAWGDYDGDGDIDLLSGNKYEPVRLHRNDGGTLTSSAVWSSAISDSTYSVAWGDFDGDKSLDFAVGNWAPNRVYRNQGGGFSASVAWYSNEADSTIDVSWGDYDGNGFLDLAVADAAKIRLYGNTGTSLTAGPVWSSTDASSGQAVAWGDYDGDGDLDLAVGAASYQPKRLYRNEGGQLTTSAVWSSADGDGATTLAWGDYDSDGDLDLVAGNKASLNRLYRNDGGDLTPASVWSPSVVDNTMDVAWGDYDGDGDLDLAVANQSDYFRPGHTRLYRNDEGALGTISVWTTSEAEQSQAVAWGDYDGDGDLDLAVGNWYQPNRLYRNDSGHLTTTAVWSSIEADATNSVAWADYDGDGDLDLAAGNYFEPDRVYRNDSGVLTTYAVWSTPAYQNTTSLAWGDYDLDGDLDLAAGNDLSRNRIYRNARNSDLPTGLPGSQLLAIGLTRPAPPANADFYSAPNIWPAVGVTIPISYTLKQPDSRPVGYIRAYYSLNGGGHWLPAVAASGTITTNLATSPTGITYTYNWDVFASGFFGKSDNVVFRIVAVPDLHPVANSVPGPFLFGSNASDTFPFRVRGTQVRVTENGQPVKDALVYRQPAGSTSPAELITSLAGEPFRTDGQGYLQGRGALDIGDTLYALAAADVGDGYTLYHTNGVPTATGLDGFTVAAPGVQTIDVSPAHPLLLFDLDVSLEWDARNDAQYLAQLNYDLQRASEFLFDWTNGQAAVGQFRIHQDRDFWQDAHIRIYASNRLRPSAVQGGVVSEPYTDTLKPDIVYYPGQLYMGATWNRYGNAGTNLDEDWPRTLAHELGHYVLYLQDNYLGKNAQGQVIPVDDCSGAMADPYRDDVAQGYGEFHLADGWLPSCANTLSHLDTGRSDWTTITTFYPQLDGNTTNAGPSILPLAVTEIHYVEPPEPPAALKAPIFFLTQDGQRVQPGSTARAFLYRGGWATDLGQPTLDQLHARGAQPGDRVCLYELSVDRLGCETVSLGDEQLALVSKPDWRPDIQVSPTTSRTLTLNVTNVPAGLSLQARLYPLDFEAGNPIALSASGNTYTGTFNQATPTFEGYVQVWVDEPEPRREALVDFTLGGNPGHQRTGGTGKRSDGGHQRTGGTPVMSADGQVILFAPDVATTEEWFYTLQATSAGVQPPPWATLVGQAYRLSATANAPDLAGSSLSFSYLGSEVPPGEEEWLKLYFHDGTKWTQLTTALDMYHNLASAPTQGPGVYALMSSIEVTTIDSPGWNLFSYPVRQARPVAEALISITGFYTTVYSYEPTDTLDPWKVYDVTVPDWVNDLHELEFGRGYWINVLEALILRLKGASVARTGQVPDEAQGIPLPPATYYGRVLPAPNYIPQAGVQVTALIGDRVCGRGQTLALGGEIMYNVNVFADGPGAGAGCGAAGREVRFRVGSWLMATTAAWSSERVWQLPLAAAGTTEPYFLPIILAQP